ncbi:Uncharacterized protein DAT39_001935 [Clarias magur]|uniref:Uncharacterized protein n=1 Tax=Clarias magur TaxID=1594786 RepID=A0A8J4UHC1_CLAMG|nr:Uncharacterized protein DAT39_001935 [Clarias magur]
MPWLVCQSCTASFCSNGPQWPWNGNESCRRDGQPVCVSQQKHDERGAAAAGLLKLTTHSTGLTQCEVLPPVKIRYALFIHRGMLYIPHSSTP